jgi:hypothetical protein
MNPYFLSKMVSLELYPHKRFDRPEILDPKPFADLGFDEGKKLIQVGARKTIVNMHGEQTMNEGQTPGSVEEKEGMVKF